MQYNLEELFIKQAELDKTILKQHGRDYASTVNERVLALLVELGELANETRCFKYWSLKQASPKEMVDEEYSDGIHFLLSLGIYLNANYKYGFTPKVYSDNLVDFFNYVFYKVSEFNFKPTLRKFYNLMNLYLGLGLKLNINVEELFQAYEKKNKVNFERQKNNY